MRLCFLVISLFLSVITSCTEPNYNQPDSETGKVNQAEFHTVNLDKFTIAKNGLNLRQAPSIESKTLKLLPLNTKVFVIKSLPSSIKITGKEGYWVLATYKGQTGWLFDSFLSEFADPSAPHAKNSKVAKKFAEKFSLAKKQKKNQPARANKAFQKLINQSKDYIQDDYICRRYYEASCHETLKIQCQKLGYQSLKIEKEEDFLFALRKAIADEDYPRIHILSTCDIDQGFYGTDTGWAVTSYSAEKYLRILFKKSHLNKLRHVSKNDIKYLEVPFKKKQQKDFEHLRFLYRKVQGFWLWHTVTWPRSFKRVKTFNQNCYYECSWE